MLDNINGIEDMIWDSSHKKIHNICAPNTLNYYAVYPLFIIFVLICAESRTLSKAMRESTLAELQVCLDRLRTVLNSPFKVPYDTQNTMFPNLWLTRL